MAKVKFTAGRVAGFQCESGKGQSFLWDAGAPLGLRATAAGAKSYIYQAKIHGKTVRVTIGDPDSWSIDDAAKEARRLQRLVDEGKDPRQVKADILNAEQEARAAKQAEAVELQAQQLRESVTLGDAWGAYIEARTPKWSALHLRDHIRVIQTGGGQRKRSPKLTEPGPLAPLRQVKLSDLSGERVTQWLESQTADRPTIAALSYRLLRAFIRWADETPTYRGIIPADAYKARSVKDAVPKANVKDGDCLQREQLSAWFDGVRKIGNPVISAYLQGLLITGARREELAALKWADVDFQWRSLSLADKMEDAGRIIPLTPYLASLLSALPRRNEWVFSSRTAKDGNITEPRLAHNQALAAAGLPKLTLHGLRRSFGTLSEWCEVPVGVVAQIMGHKPSALAEKHYRRRPLDLLRSWHDKIEVWILEQAGIDFKPEQAQPGLRAVVK